MVEMVNTETGEITQPVIVKNALTRVRVAKHFPSPSLAKQSFLEECDINNIMRKYQKTGLIEHLNTHKGEYGNFIGFESYHVSLNQILEADQAFSTIPSSVRKKFDNDPRKFLEFAQNPDNLDEMIEMGLAPPKVQEAPNLPESGNTPDNPASPSGDAPTAAETSPAA